MKELSAILNIGRITLDLAVFAAFLHKYSVVSDFLMSYTDRRKILLGGMALIVGVTLLGGYSSFASSNAQNADNDNDSPTDGFNIHATVNKHDSENLDHQMDHYCKLDDKIVAVCLLFDGDEANSHLAQVEFIISAEQYEQLPEREKFQFHNHAVELTPQRGEPAFVELPEGVDGGELLNTLKGTYGKVVTVWDPSDPVPGYPPYVFQVDSPHALGQDENDNLHCEWLAADAEPCEDETETASNKDKNKH